MAGVVSPGHKGDSPHQSQLWFERETPSFVPISERELELGECIGSGAFGQVYKAKYKGRVVAVKFTSDSKKKEFEAELRALMSVNHPNIIRLYGASIAPPRFFLVMELGAKSLHNYIRENTYEMVDVYKWALQIAEGMGHLHTKNVIHRDLKTANILLDSRKLVKICDFGTSRDFNQTTIMTFVGTISYMAPELLREQAVSEKIDVYSYAVVLWEMITRKTPYLNMKPVQIMWLVANEGSRLPIPDDCPKLFRMIIDDSWKHDSHERPSFKVILGKLMSAIGTELEIKGDSKTLLRPLSEQQSQWSQTIDKTIEGFKTLANLKDEQSRQLKQRQEDLDRKEAALQKKARELAVREIKFEEQQMYDEGSTSDSEMHTLKRMSSVPDTRKKNRTSTRMSFNKFPPREQISTDRSSLSPAGRADSGPIAVSSPSPISPSAQVTVKRQQPALVITTSQPPAAGPGGGAPAPGGEPGSAIRSAPVDPTATPASSNWAGPATAEPATAEPATAAGGPASAGTRQHLDAVTVARHLLHHGQHSREASAEDESETSSVVTEKAVASHSRDLSQDMLEADTEESTAAASADNMPAIVLPPGSHSRETSDEFVSAPSSATHSREASYSTPMSARHPSHYPQTPQPGLDEERLLPVENKPGALLDASPSRLTAAAGDASVGEAAAPLPPAEDGRDHRRDVSTGNSGSSHQSARPSVVAAASGQRDVDHDLAHDHDDGDDDAASQDSVIVVSDRDDDDGCDDEEEEARKAALVGMPVAPV